MIKYCLLILLVFVWSLSFYWHFFGVLSPGLLIAYVGTGSPVKFVQMFYANGVDLWTFPKEQALRGSFRMRGPFRSFRHSSYSRMLLIHKVMPIPYHMDMVSVVEYRKHNDTVASMWPRLTVWPPTRVLDPIDWYRSIGGHVVTVIM